MRTNWVAAAVGVMLAALVAALGLVFVGEPEPTTRMDELINQSFTSGPPGSMPDPRPWLQQWIDPAGRWFERYEPMPSHLTPERLHGGIM